MEKDFNRTGATYTMEDEMESFQQRVKDWASDRNLIKGSSPMQQMAKLVEEVGELNQAILDNSLTDCVDAIGDVQVVLAVMCAQLNLHIDQCREAAWIEIKDRKGQMVDGVFVKEDG